MALALVIIAYQNLSLRKELVEAPRTVDKAQVVLDNIHARKSVRKFTSQQVPDSLLELLMKAAMAAPTGHDARPWQFIITKDHAVMKALRSNLKWARGLDYSQAAIIVCGDMRKVKPENKEFWITDCSAATENILLASEALGLGAVWSTLYPGEDRMQHARNVLGLPSYLMPLCVIPVGYPAEEVQPKIKYDPSRVHWEKYTEN